MPAAHQAKAANKDEVVHVESEVVVLYAYSEPSVYWIAKMYLETQGFRLLTAESAAELLKVYQENREEIDLVVIGNYRLHRGQHGGRGAVEGPEILAMLQAIDPAVRCAFITGSPLRSKLDALKKGGAVGILLKPWRAEELLLALREWSLR
jgi:CheY-like chemotaxis protein